ncbi:hypothetical protein LEN26_010167 [Aphanomyces euteiches]|nr:hypothetical protein AeMF1_016799 [Aphanomyces euteiches]KAH9122640.1 hypothetical protein LEN26_010167 [Aphanomyces euteiches]KAH9196790.1 hypothetical protein AeNC1_001221 [Aphanomyces euteiches]
MTYSEMFALIQVTAFSDFSGLGRILLASLSFWCAVVLVSFSSILFDVVVMYLYRMYLPTNHDIIKEIDCRLDSRGGFRMRSRGSISSMGSVTMGSWSKKLRKKNHLTDHDELCAQLSSLESDIAREKRYSSRDENDGFTVTKMPPIHPITMEFMGEDYEPLEAEYNRVFAEREANRMARLVSLILLCIPLYSFVEFFVEHATTMYPFRIIMFLGALIYYVYTRTKWFVANYQISVLVPMAMAGILCNQSIKYTGKFSVTFFAVIAFSVVRVKFVYAVWLVLFNFFYFLGSNELGLTNIASSSETKTMEQILFSVFMVFLVGFAAYGNYYLQMTMKLEFVQLKILKHEERRSRDILKNMVPDHIVKQIELGATLVSEEENDIALLFCDIGDFSAMMKRYSPREMVVLLDRIYSLFDKLCMKHGVRKMETVGKVYLACAGLRGNAKGKEAALRAAALSRDMMTQLAKCKTKKGHGVKIRIGLHCGRVISGLVGMKKQQFSLFGDTVNTASRMQSTGVTGRIQISHAMFELLENDFEYEPRTVEAKGKGLMKTYLLGRPVTTQAQRACRGHYGFKMSRNSIEMSRRCLVEELQRTLSGTWGNLAAQSWRTWWIEYPTSMTYSYIGLDTLFVAFLASTGGSIMHKHTILVNLIFIAWKTAIFLVLLFCYERPDLSEGERLRVYPLILFFFVAISNVMSRRDVEYFCRRRFLSYTQTGEEAAKADRLLYKMLPNKVVTQLKDGETVCDQHHNVGILFSDIKGFTSIAARAQTDQVVNLLATLFVAFDKLTEKHGVFKMQTIGDAYVIVSGLPYNDVPLEINVKQVEVMQCECYSPSNHDVAVHAPLEEARISAPQDEAATQAHLRRLIYMASDMHDEVAKLRDPTTGDRLQMRIGIHVGTIITGVIGTSTLRFDMWGPDVLTANEMESNSQPGKTLVSRHVMEKAQACCDLKFSFHSTIDLTGINAMDTFFVDTDPSKRSTQK